MPGGPGGLPGPIPGGNIPLSEEWFKATKKLLKEGGVKESPEDSSDVYTPSAAAQQLPSTKGEKMLASVKAELMELDPESETFLPDATEKLIGSVIEQEYGEHMSRSEGFPQMQEKLTRTILENPHYREQVTDLLEIMLMTQPHPEAMEEFPEEEA